MKKSKIRYNMMGIFKKLLIQFDMKKIKKNETIILSPVKIYWDVVEEIYERIKSGRNVEIESGEYTYKNLEELKQENRKGYIRKLKFSGRSKGLSNDIHVEIKTGSVWIHQDFNSTETVAKIKDILIKNSPWYMYSPNSSAWHALEAIVGFLTALAFFHLSSRLENILLSVGGYLIGFGVIIWIFKKEPILGEAKIFTFLKKDNLSFLERNKDKLLRDLIIALSVGVVSFLLGYLLPK